MGRAVEAGLDAGWNTVPGMYALLSGQLLGLMLERVLALLGVTGPDALAVLDAAAEATPAGPLLVVQEGFDTPASIRGRRTFGVAGGPVERGARLPLHGAVRITGAMGASPARPRSWSSAEGGPAAPACAGAGRRWCPPCAGRR